MVLRPLAVLVALTIFAPPASAAERSVYVGSFAKLRVQGPFEVKVATGSAAGATLTGDQQTIDGVEVQVEGDTLILRNAIGRWQERPRAVAAQPVTIALTTPALIVTSVTGGGRVNITAMKGARLDLSVTGSGAISVGAVTGDAANATVIGGGSITLAGRAGTARLMTNGSGTIDAAGLDVGDLVVRVDGPGTTRARARFTAAVVDTGLGQISIAGQPKCTVKADAGGPVTCGGG